MNLLRQISLSLCLLMGHVSEASAELRLAGIFADHMVVQCDRTISIWGWAEPGQKVRVEFAHQVVDASARADGTWEVSLSPLQANGKGQRLRVEGENQSIEIQDVLVGEVWHASGQSNMAMNLGAMSRELEVVKRDIAEADLPALRFCRIQEPASPTPLTDLSQQATWTVCSPTKVPRISGVAFYFARRLHRELGVPIAVIDTSRGGTPIEPFIPRSAFQSHPTLQRELELGDLEDLESIWKLPGGVRARDGNWLPGRLFHSRLAPIRRFSVRGLIWYQGESNCGVQEDPRDYQHKMRALVQGWREAFGRENLPVYWVQLPGSGAGPGWPYLREQQRLALDLPGTGMVVTLDLEGAGIHPANKIDVGHRLARWALAKDYGRSIPFSGPLFDRQEILDSRIVLHFRHADNGLMVGEKDGLAEPRELPASELKDFEVADPSGRWHQAVATMEGATVSVHSTEVQTPMAVRYAGTVQPTPCYLYNRDGLPASPFCSRPELWVYDPQLPK